MHKRITSTERIFLTQRLATYLRAGIPLIQALDLLRGSMRRAHDAIFADIMESVRNGHPLSYALAPYPRVLPSLYRQIIAAGEASGGLSTSLERTADLLLRKQKLVRSCASALAYPAVVCLGTLGITSLLLLYALPKMIPLFSGLHASLPVSTRILIAISSGISDHTIAIIECCGVLLAVSMVLWRIPYTKIGIESILLATPFLGRMLQGFLLSSLFLMIAELLESGVPIIRALALARESVSNTSYEAGLIQIEESVTQGMHLTASMRLLPKQYPRIAIQLIEVGERTGTLPRSIRMVSEFYEEQLDRDLAVVSAALEPALLIITGCIVGFVALAVISPMYSITQSFSL